MSQKHELTFQELKLLYRVHFEPIIVAILGILPPDEVVDNYAGTLAKRREN